MNSLIQRKKLWEIEEWLFCSICGTCLNIEEQKVLLAKQTKGKKTLKDYEIHILMINSAKTMNKVSINLNKLLDKKYTKEIDQYSDLDDTKFKEVWTKKLREGDICGLYWVAVSSTNISEKLLLELYQDVHMLSHLNGRQVREERNLLNLKIKEIQLLKERIKKDNKEKTVLKKELERNRISIRKLEKSLTDNKLTSDLSTEILKLEEQNTKYRTELNNACKQITDLENYNNIIINENEHLKLNIEKYKNLNQQLLTCFDNISSEECSCKEECCDVNECPKRNYCKRVLLVGGFTRLRTYYQKLIESKGMELTYHDGYLRNGESNLKNMIRNSDIVICPVDINSHAACLSTKKICKMLNKQFYFLDNSSLTSIERTLDSIIADISN